MIILGLLPIFYFLGLLLIFLRDDDLPSAWIKSAVIWGLTIWVITEGQSLLNMINPAVAVATWVPLTVASFWIGCAIQRKQNWQRLHDIAHLIRRNSWLCIALASILLPCLVIALVSATNTYDSLTYHLPRVMHWRQNGNLGHYDTPIIRQLYMHPFAEFCILQFDLLTASDRWANFVQWGACLTSLMGVAGLAHKFGCSRKGITLAVIFAVTIPTGIIQSATTRNDYVTAAYFISMLFFGAKTLRQPSWSNFGWQGIAFGLAVTTKPTAGFFALPFLLLQCIVLVQNNFHALPSSTPVKSLIFAVSRLALVSVITSILLGPHLTRNYLWSKTLTGPFSGETMESVSPTAVTFNLVRNIALHGNLTQSLTTSFVHKIRALHHFAGISPEDPQTAKSLKEPFHKFHVRPYHSSLDPSGSYAGAPFHVLIILLSLLLVILRPSILSKRIFLYYGLSLMAGALIFCFIIKSSPFRARIHLPLIIAAAPFIAVVGNHLMSRRTIFLCFAIMLILSIPVVFQSHQKPLLSFSDLRLLSRELIGKNNLYPLSKFSRSILLKARIDQYFTDCPQYISLCRDFDQHLEDDPSIRTVQLRLSPVSCEYLFWVIARAKSRDIHFVVTDSSENTEHPSDSDIIVDCKSHEVISSLH